MKDIHKTHHTLHLLYLKKWKEPRMTWTFNQYGPNNLWWKWWLPLDNFL